MRLSDILERKGHQVHTASPEETVMDAVHKLVAHNIGALAVVDSAGKLVGVISDGDLRRWMERTEKTGENLLAKKAKDIMTKNPKVTNREALAAEAVAIMERNSITCLIVTDPDAKPEGVIHLHDLLKAGVV